LINDGSVAHVDVEQDLDSVVFFIEEINLILQLLQVALIHFLLVLHVYMVHVLTALIKHTKSQNFIISDFNCSVEGFYFVLNGKMLLHERV